MNTESIGLTPIEIKKDDNTNPDLLKAKGRGRPAGQKNITAEQEISAEVIIDLLEGVKQERTQDTKAKFTPRLKEAFTKAFNKTLNKHECKLFDDKPEIVLVFVFLYMIFDAIGKEFVFNNLKALTDKGIELCKKTV